MENQWVICIFRDMPKIHFGPAGFLTHLAAHLVRSDNLNSPVEPRLPATHAISGLAKLTIDPGLAENWQVYDGKNEK